MRSEACAALLVSTPGCKPLDDLMRKLLLVLRGVVCCVLVWFTTVPGWEVQDKCGSV